MGHQNLSSDTTKETKMDLAYKTIRHKILTNELLPRDTLTEVKLCEELNLSRTPVRGALQRLAYDGLVKYIPGKGMTVSQFVLADLLEIAEIRIPNECIAVGLAVERMTDEEIQELGRCVDETEAAAKEQRSETCFELDNRFHILIAKGSKNNWVQQIVTELVEVSERGTFLSKKDYDRMLVAAELHRKVYDAMKARNKDLAMQRMNEHLENWIEYTKQQQLKNFYLYR